MIAVNPLIADLSFCASLVVRLSGIENTAKRCPDNAIVVLCPVGTDEGPGAGCDSTGVFSFDSAAVSNCAKLTLEVLPNAIVGDSMICVFWSPRSYKSPVVRMASLNALTQEADRSFGMPLSCSKIFFRN